MKPLIWMAAWGLCSLLSADLQAQNLLLNGKFNPQEKGWETLRSQGELPKIEQSSAYKAYGLSDKFAGLSFVELDALSAVQQTVATEKGEKYTLVYSYSHRPNAGDKQLIVLLNGKPIYTETIPNTSEPGRFRYHHCSFTADNAQSTLAFYVVSLSGEENQGVLLTDVSLGKESEINLNLYYSY